jgi:CheY-like chemotaxis protein
LLALVASGYWLSSSEGIPRGIVLTILLLMTLTACAIAMRLSMSSGVEEAEPNLGDEVVPDGAVDPNPEPIVSAAHGHPCRLDYSGACAPDQASSLASSIIYTSADAVPEVINQVLDCARLEKGNLPFRTAPMSLHALVVDVVKQFQEEARSKRVKLRSVGLGNCPDEILCDETRLRQVLTTLVGNAVKFTDAGEVIIRTQSAVAPRGDRLSVQIDVEDTGSGMDEVTRTALFLPLSEWRSGVIAAGDGAGLGLRVAGMILAKMGGSLEISSQPGKGTRACARLEVSVTPVSTGRPEEAADGDGAEGQSSRKRILLAEDNESNSAIAKHYLDLIGYDVTWARNGTEAVALYKSQRFDVVLMDALMPELDGYQATREIRLFESEAKIGRTPILALTANISDDEEQRCLDSGMTAYLAKPYKLVQLKQVIESLA